MHAARSKTASETVRKRSTSKGGTMLDRVGASVGSLNAKVQIESHHIYDVVAPMNASDLHCITCSTLRGMDMLTIG
jgi:hypothetical protein